jgi:hypothetical protein
MLFNDAVHCKDYIALMIDEQMSMEHWRTDSHKKKKNRVLRLRWQQIGTKLGPNWDLFSEGPVTECW